MYVSVLPQLKCVFQVKPPLRIRWRAAVMWIDVQYMHMYSRYKWAMLPPTGQQRNCNTPPHIQYIQSKTHWIYSWNICACMQSLTDMFWGSNEVLMSKTLIKLTESVRGKSQSHAKVMRFKYKEQLVIIPYKLTENTILLKLTHHYLCIHSHIDLTSLMRLLHGEIYCSDR